MKQNNFEEKIYDYFAQNKEVPQNIKESINDIELNRKIRKRFNIYSFRKAIVAMVSIVTISTGIVFAKDIEEFARNMFNDKPGIETAIENGYSYENTLSNSIVSQDIKVSAQDMIMDDHTLNINILAEFDNNIDLTKVKKVYTPDVFFIDENDNVLSYSLDISAVKKFLNNCDNNFIINHSINSTLDSGYEKKDEKSIILTYSSSAIEEKFPKSKKIYVGFNTLILKNEETLDAEEQIINGNWLIEIDVPEVFKDREDSIKYQVVYCNNDNIYKDTIIANVSETGMRFEMKMYWGEYEYWHEKTEMLRNSGDVFGSQLIKQEESYIENESGEKFYTSLISGENGYSFSNNGNLYNKVSFNITKYDVTDRLKVVYKTIDNEQIIIELEKAK